MKLVVEMRKFVGRPTMKYVNMICHKEDIIDPENESKCYEVLEFDAWDNYDILNEFFGAHDKSLMCSKEEYFDGFDRTTWTDYVIMEHGKIITRAAIYINNVDSWEVAGVSTLPDYRWKGYAEAVVRYCTWKIIEADKAATLTTKETNAAMINTAKKVGYKM